VENQRLLLAAFLSALILIIWNVAFPPVPPPADEPISDPAAFRIEEGLENVERVTENPSPESPDGEPKVSRIDPEREELIAVSSERVVLENDLIRAEFDNLGAQLVSLQLLGELTFDGKPIEMIRQRGSDPGPFALAKAERESGQFTKSHRLNKALFVWDRSSTNEVRFRHQSDRGSAEKIFTLDEQGFLSVQIRVPGESGWAILVGPGLRNLTEKEYSSRYLQRGVGYRVGDDTDLLVPGKNEEEQVLAMAGLSWVTLEDNFFLGALVPQEGIREFVIRPVQQRLKFDSEQSRFLPFDTALGGEEMTEEQMLLLPSTGEAMRFEMYFGAKRYGTLVKLPYHLEDAVRWGFVGFLAKPLYFGLEWLHRSVVPNYGWAIILMTLIVRLLFFPLTWKSQSSMTKMQELNPKVQAIRNKYKSKTRDKQGKPNLDAQRQMNDEVMAVYRTAGVNPMSGCLPMLLQMPVFFALFKLLSNAVELRNAPWIGWIHDLSNPDPMYILPILMGVSSLVMQKMLPSAGDPMQRRIMQTMPIVFTVFAFAFPSGLVLYWVTSNLFTMAQQKLLLEMKARAES
jgi:YidC/Oxa1 family membrane protein insertase